MSIDEKIRTAIKLAIFPILVFVMLFILIIYPDYWTFLKRGGESRYCVCNNIIIDASTTHTQI